MNPPHFFLSSHPQYKQGLCCALCMLWRRPVFPPRCSPGLLSPHWTTVSGHLLQTPAAAWPGIASRCLCTYACHVVSALRCALTLSGLMVAYSLLIAMIATLRYSSPRVCVCVCALWAHPSRYGPCPSWLVRPLHLRESTVRIQHGSCRFMGLTPLFSMLYFTWFCILLPPFLLLLG